VRLPTRNEVAILMTLEGEYYLLPHNEQFGIFKVAILMTLEGEYYYFECRRRRADHACRNPHDIGRRILHDTFVTHRPAMQVAILMTLEGEYYPNMLRGWQHSYYSRNPHDIGRRILLYI